MDLGRTATSPPPLAAEFDANAQKAGVIVKILNGENIGFIETVNLDPATTHVRSLANPATGVNASTPHAIYPRTIGGRRQPSRAAERAS